MLGTTEVRNLTRSDLWPAFAAERARLNKIRTWYRSDHMKPWMPTSATPEFKQLAELSSTPWGRLVVMSVAQLLFVDGFRRELEEANTPAWAWWQANGMDKRQSPLHRDALAYGLSYETVIPGTVPLTGEPIPVMTPVSPREMVAFYRDEDEPEWPEYAIRCKPARLASGERGWSIRVLDDEVVHYLQCDADGDQLTYIEHRGHGAPVCPVVRFTCVDDSEGGAEGDIEPFISVFGRIDQTTFDRMVVQRFASWVVRTIAGMAKPDEGDAEAEKQRLSAEKILVAEDPDTKFGSLPASPLDGFISARKADIEDLAAVSQTPGNVLLKGLDNPPSAEALAADEAGLHRKTGLVRVSFGESHEQSFRLGSAIMGDKAGASDVTAQIRWRDMEHVSLVAVADSVAKLKDILPAELLLERIPGMTDTDLARAKKLIEAGSPLDRLLIELRAGQTSAPPVPAPAA